MARAYKPSMPFSVPMKLLTPVQTRVQGATKKTFTEPDASPLFWGSFRTFGGSETTRDGEFVVVDTATVDTWYRPDIKADCRIYMVDTGEIYEIIATPEDIDRRHQWMQLKLHRIGGKA